MDNFDLAYIIFVKPNKKIELIAGLEDYYLMLQDLSHHQSLATECDGIDSTSHAVIFVQAK